MTPQRIKEKGRRGAPAVRVALSRLPLETPAQTETSLSAVAKHRSVHVKLGNRDKRAAAALADRAWTEGLADVAYGWTDSPFGPLLLAVTKKGLVRVAYPDHDADRELAELAAAVSPRVLEIRGATDGVRRELEEYFEGRRRRFELPVDLTPVRGFTRKVLRATARIPFGSVRTYRDVATKAGSPAATRAAGNALGSNPVPIVVPCHRVIRTGGGLGGYTGGVERKQELLRLEGVLQR